jgi:hypothetical protein
MDDQRLYHNAGTGMGLQSCGLSHAFASELFAGNSCDILRIGKDVLLNENVILE